MDKETIKNTSRNILITIICLYLFLMIMPFIILDSDKAYYMRGLKEYQNDKMFLTDTIKNEQDIYENVCEEMLDFEI